MTIGVDVLVTKAGDPVFEWCLQYLKPVVKNSGETWNAGDIVVHDATNGRFNKSSSQKQVGIKCIVAYGAASGKDIAVVYFAPAWAYSKYLPAAALKNFALVQCSATAGGWEAKTADAAYADMIHTVGFAQVMGKAGQLMGSSDNDATDIAQNEMTKLRLIY